MKTLKLWSKEITVDNSINNTLVAIAAPKWYTTIFATAVKDGAFDDHYVMTDLANLPEGVESVQYVVIPVAKDFVEDFAKLVNCKTISVDSESVSDGKVTIKDEEVENGEYYFIKVSTPEMEENLVDDPDFSHGYVNVPITWELLNLNRQKWAEIGVTGTGWYRIGIFKDSETLKRIRTRCLVSIKNFHGEFTGSNQEIQGDVKIDEVDDDNSILVSNLPQ